MFSVYERSQLRYSPLPQSCHVFLGYYEQGTISSAILGDCYTVEEVAMQYPCFRAKASKQLLLVLWTGNWDSSRHGSICRSGSWRIQSSYRLQQVALFTGPQ